MRSRAHIPLTLALAAGTTLALAGPAEASLQKCVDKASKHPYRELGRSSKAILFDSGGFVYGCAYSGSKVRKLPGQKPAADKQAIDRGHVVLAEGFAGYATRRKRGDHAEWIYVVDVKSGTLKHSSDEQDDIKVGSLVLKDDGSVAWIYSWHPERSNGWTRVMKIDGTGSGPQLVDSDEAHHDDPNVLRSLEITQGGTHLSWATKLGGRIATGDEPPFE